MVVVAGGGGEAVNGAFVIMYPVPLSITTGGR